MRSLRRALCLASVVGIWIGCAVNQAGLGDGGNNPDVGAGSGGSAGAAAGVAGAAGSAAPVGAAGSAISGRGGVGGGSAGTSGAAGVTGSGGNTAGAAGAVGAAGTSGAGGAGAGAGNAGAAGNAGSPGSAGASGGGTSGGAGNPGAAGSAGTPGAAGASGSGGTTGGGGIAGSAGGGVAGIGGLGGSGGLGGIGGIGGSIGGSNAGRGGSAARGGTTGRGGATGRGGSGGNPCLGYPSGVKSFVTPTDGRAHCYWTRSSSQTWSEAQQSCMLQNGHLVTILSAEENAFVVSIAQFSSSFDDTWIGATDGKPGTDRNGAGTYRWVSNEAWGYSNWEQGQPDGYCDPCSAGQSCTCDHRAVLSSNGTWNDRWQDNTRSSVCEATPN